jgi:hypothetical protein
MPVAVLLSIRTAVSLPTRLTIRVFILSYFDGQCKPLTDVIEKADLVFYFAFVGLYVVRNKPKM